MENEMDKLKYMEQQCVAMNKRLKRRYNSGAICIMVDDPHPSEPDKWEMADDELAEILADIDFVGAVVDVVSRNIIKFVPFEGEFPVEDNELEQYLENSEEQEYCPPNNKDWKKYIG